MCDLRNDCDRPGLWAPKVIVRLTSGTGWIERPAYLNLRVCDRCRVKVQQPSDVLEEGGKGVVAQMIEQQPGMRFVKFKMAWVLRDSAEGRKFLPADDE